MASVVEMAGLLSGGLGALDCVAYRMLPALHPRGLLDLLPVQVSSGIWRCLASRYVVAFRAGTQDFRNPGSVEKDTRDVKRQSCYASM